MSRERARVVGLLAGAAAIGVGWWALRLQPDATHDAASTRAEALTLALRAEDDDARAAAFAQARAAADEAMRRDASLLSFDPYPAFVRRAIDELGGAASAGPSPLSDGVEAMRRLDLTAAHAHFSAARQVPPLAAKAALYLRLLDELGLDAVRVTRTP